MAESVSGMWEKYTDNEPIDLERSATTITVEKREREDGRTEVRARFPAGPTPLYFGPPFTFDSSGFVLFFSINFRDWRRKMFILSSEFFFRLC